MFNGNLRLSTGLMIVALLATFGSGCAQLQNALKGPKDHKAEAEAKVDQAIAKGDLAALESMCQTHKVGETKLGYTKHEQACDAAGKLLAEKFADVPCDEADAYWKDAQEIDRDMKGRLHNAYGLKLAECDRWQPIFVDLMHWGQAWDRGSKGYKLIAQLGEAGEPVEEKFVNYLNSTDKPLAIDNSGYAMSHFLKWRLDQKDGKSCDAYVPAMDKLDANASHMLLIYFKEQTCEAAAPAAIASLGADSASTRIVACQLLGKIGGAAALKKVKIVAEKDGYSKKQDFTVVYPVRDACSQAMAKIELRQ